jgi:hypothetical protein
MNSAAENLRNQCVGLLSGLGCNRFFDLGIIRDRKQPFDLIIHTWVRRDAGGARGFRIEQSIVNGLNLSDRCHELPPLIASIHQSPLFLLERIENGECGKSMSERSNGVDCSAVNVVLANSSGDIVRHTEQAELRASNERFGYRA